MILVALGSNSNGPWGTPRDAVAEALRRLNAGGIKLKKVSQLLVTAPFGVTDQPDFINAVAEIETQLPPEDLLQRLHVIERLAGRQRTLRWGGGRAATVAASACSRGMNLVTREAALAAMSMASRMLMSCFTTVLLSVISRPGGVSTGVMRP